MIPADPYPTSTLRLLSPTRRRICIIDVDRATADTHLAKCLRTAGWTEYRGTARIDKRGWVVPGTDLAIDRIATARNVNLRQEYEA